MTPNRPTKRIYVTAAQEEALDYAVQVIGGQCPEEDEFEEWERRYLALVDLRIKLKDKDRA